MDCTWANTMASSIADHTINLFHLQPITFKYRSRSFHVHYKMQSPLCFATAPQQTASITNTQDVIQSVASSEPCLWHSMSPRRCRRHEGLSVSSSSPWAGADCLALYHKTTMVSQLMNWQIQTLYHGQPLLPYQNFYHNPLVSSLWPLFLTAVTHNTVK